MTSGDLLLKDFKPKPRLKRPDNTPEKAKHPVIDVHNHLFGRIPADEMVAIMDQVGLKTFVNLSGNPVLDGVSPKHSPLRVCFARSTPISADA